MTMTDGARRVAAGYAATGGTAHGADLIEQRLLFPTNRTHHPATRPSRGA